MMEDFFKKHNFISNDLKRKNRKFNIIRYYPKIQTYEFINVGIILADENEIFYRLLEEEEISKLHCPSLIKSKILKNSLDTLDSFLQNKQELNITIDTISNRYKNILDTSFQLIHSGTEKSEDLIEKLFYDYIGYKFNTEEKISKLSKIIDETENLIKKEFNGYLKIKKSKINGYNLDFLNTKTNFVHHSLLGSIENSENVARAFLNVPISLGNSKYDFLNTRFNISNNGISNKIKLSHLNINVYSYYDEEQIANYCKNLI